MDKRQILWKITNDEDEMWTLSHIFDQLERGRERSIPVATAFLTPREAHLTASLLEQLRESCRFDGGYEGAERVVALFLPDYLEPLAYSKSEEYPLCALRCTYRSERKLSHRDILGSLMSLGIRRNLLGDLLVSDDCCDIVCKKEIVEFLLLNFISAAHVSLRTERIDLANLHIPAVRRRQLRDTVSSLRADSLVASAFRFSRSRAAELIRSGRLDLNWHTCDKVDHICVEGDTLTVRGFGKAVLLAVEGESKKGRIIVRFERY